MSDKTPSTNLSLEAQFTVVSYMTVAEGASKEQLLQLYSELLRSYLSQKQYYESLVKTKWGLDGADKRDTED